MKCNKRQQQLATSETIKPNKHQRVLETIVKNATQMWCSNPIHLRNPLQFLQLSSHCINDTFMDASQIQLSAAMDAADTSHDNDDHDERSFNLLKSNAISRKIKSSTIKDFKRNSISGNINATTNMTNITDCVNVPPQINGNNDSNISMVHIESSSTKAINVTNSNVNEINFNKSEPPPLAFYPKNRGNTQAEPIIFSATEPPPLVPIARFNFA